MIFKDEHMIKIASQCLKMYAGNYNVQLYYTKRIG